MNTYVTTRLERRLIENNLSFNDLCIIDPILLLSIRNLGRKSYHTALDILERQGKKPGTWNDLSVSAYPHMRLKYYIKHRNEIIKSMADGQKESILPEEKDEYKEFRKQASLKIFCTLLQNDEYMNKPFYDIALHAVSAADRLISELDYNSERNDTD